MVTVPSQEDQQKQGQSKFLLEPGEYECTLVEFKFGKVSEGKPTSGSDMLTLKFEAKNGVWLYDNLIFAPNTVWKAGVFLAALGVEAGKKVDLSEATMPKLIGKKITLRVKQEDYLGHLRNRLEAYVMPDSIPF